MGENWIRIIAAFYELNRPDMIICPVSDRINTRVFEKIPELEFLSLQGITAALRFRGRLQCVTVQILLYKGSVS